MTRPLSVRDALERLAPEVVLTPENEGAARDAVQRLQSSPWYLRVLMAFGAWIGTWFLLSFVLGILAAILSGEVEGVAIVVGLGLLAAAIALRYYVQNDFVHQLALVVSFTGQSMFIGGIGATTRSVETAAVAGLVMCVALVVAFPDRVHRFLSTGLAVGALMVLVIVMKIPSGAQVVAMILIGLTLGIWRAAPLSWRTAHHEIVAPVAGGAIISLFGLLLTSTLVGFLSPTDIGRVLQGGPTTAAAVLGLLWLVHEVMDDHEPGRFGKEAMAASAAIVALAALTWRTPSIVTTLLIIVLGFDRRSRTIVALAIAFFLAFGALYYYNLSLTLLQKSGVLVGSGMLSLIAWGVLRRITVTTATPEAAS